MNFEIIKKHKIKIFLSLILIVGFILRFYNLTLQSLWYDELYSIVLSSEHSIWNIILECGKDVHPPFFQIALFSWFKLFPATEFFARLYPFTLGVFTLPLIYFLGKELYEENTGLIASALASVNFFFIYYSQEVRSYSQNVCLVVLSTLLLIKLLKKPTVLKAIIYGLITLMLMYTHYFGLLIAAIQGIFVIFYLLIIKPESLKDFFKLSISGIIVVFGYIPWVPSMLNQMETKDFWIKPVKNWFFVDYIVNYFTNKEVALIVVILFFLSLRYLINANKNFKKNEKWNYKTSTYFLFTIVFLSYLLPYLKSIESSILTPRNTIVTLPFLLIGAAASIKFIPKNYFKTILIIILIILNVHTVVTDKQGFMTKQKEKWREAVKVVLNNANKENTIVISEDDFKQYSYFQYYFKHFKSDIKVLHPSSYQLLEMINKIGEKVEIWTLEGHWKPEVSKENLKILKAYFKLSEKFYFKTVKVRKYVLKNKKNLEFLKTLQKNIENKHIILKNINNKYLTFSPLRINKKRNYEVGYLLNFKIPKVDEEKINNLKWKVVNLKNNKTVNSKDVLEFFGLDYYYAIDSKWIKFIYQNKFTQNNFSIFQMKGNFPKSSFFQKFPNNFKIQLSDNENKTYEVSINSNQKQIINEKFLNKISGKGILISDYVKTIKKSKNKYYFSNNHKLHKFLLENDFESSIDYLKKFNLLNLVVFDNSPYLNKKFMKILTTNDLFKKIYNGKNLSIYKLNDNFKYDYSTLDKLVFSWTALKNHKITSYFNKKNKERSGYFLPLTDGIIATGLEEKSSLIVTFANGKTWKKNSGYIKVNPGFYRFRIKAKSLSEKTTIYPLISLYDNLGNNITTYEGEKMEIDKYGFYNIRFGTRYIKTTYPYLELPLNCKTIAFSLYFYKEKGSVFVNEVQILENK